MLSGSVRKPPPCSLSRWCLPDVSLCVHTSNTQLITCCCSASTEKHSRKLVFTWKNKKGRDRNSQLMLCYAGSSQRGVWRRWLINTWLLSYHNTNLWCINQPFGGLSGVTELTVPYFRLMKWCKMLHPNTPLSCDSHVHDTLEECEHLPSAIYYSCLWYILSQEEQ